MFRANLVNSNGTFSDVLNFKEGEKAQVINRHTGEVLWEYTVPVAKIHYHHYYADKDLMMICSDNERDPGIVGGKSFAILKEGTRDSCLYRTQHWITVDKGESNG